MTREVNIHILRRITQVAFILLIVFAPVLDIFRFDSASGNLIVLGNEWSLGLEEGFYEGHGIENASHVAWRFFLKAILPWVLVLSIFPLLGALTGRFFCGWFCPEGAVFELFDFLTSKILGRRSLFSTKPNDSGVPAKNRVPYIIFSVFCMIFIPLLTGAVLTGYFVAPRTVWTQIINMEFTFGVKAGIIGVSIYVFLSAMIIRHTLCKYICGAGLMQTLFGWVSPRSIRVGIKPSRLSNCTDCKACERVCFMDVRPRLPKKDINCVNCGECISACKNELGEGNEIFCFTRSDTAARVDKKLQQKDINGVSQKA